MSAPTDVAVKRTLIDATTGELLELDAASDLLAAAVVEFKRREAQLKDWRQLAERELLMRLQEQNRRRATVGEWEIEVESSGRGRVWDPDELEAACRELVEAGTLRAGEITGLLTPQPPKVDGKLAAGLLTRVTDSARAALERCYRWEQKGRPRLAVRRSAQLPDKASPVTLQEPEREERVGPGEGNSDAPGPPATDTEDGR